MADRYSGIVCAEYCELLVRLNNPQLERVVLWKIEGYTNHEIARKLNRTRRTVQRSLETVRERWLQDLGETHKSSSELNSGSRLVPLHALLA